MTYPSDRIEFSSLGKSYTRNEQHIYLDRFFLGTIGEHDDGWRVDLRDTRVHGIEREDEAREVVRMWVDRNYDAMVKWREEIWARERLREQRRAAWKATQEEKL